MGVKALIYFEIVTTLALIIGLVVVKCHEAGCRRHAGGQHRPMLLKTISQSHPSHLKMIVHAFPSSVIDAMVRGDVLQIVAFSVLFALAVSAIGEKGAADRSRSCKVLR